MAQSDVSKRNFAVWFELPARDFGRAKRFYEEVFGFPLIEENMGEARMAVFPDAGEAVSGCIVTGEGHQPHRDGTVVYLNASPDLTTQLARVEKAGGKVLVDKTFISADIGYYAHILDTEGNRVGLHSTR